MVNPVAALHDRLQAAISAALGPEFAGADPVLRPSQHADVQANAAMALAKRTGRQPREVANAIVEHLDATDLVEKAEIAGAGFINLRFTDAALGAAVAGLLADDRLGVPEAKPAEQVVIDYSSPNLAKEMHIGHLRSTIIGDALARVLAFVGHNVVRQNHFGDWGTQFGMLVEHMVDIGARPGDQSLSDLNQFYKQASSRFTTDPDFAERARQRVVALQSGDADTLRFWQAFVSESVAHARAVYDRLGVLLTPEDDMPESAYNDALAGVAADLEQSGIAQHDQGALVVFTEGYEAPLFVRKRDEGYGYDTTDLAGIRYRRDRLGGTWLIYVVGSPQSQHFAQVFDAARRAGWLDGEDGPRAVHVAFGNVLGPDGKMYKTRTGENIKLTDLLDEAVLRAEAVVRDKNPDLSEDERAAIARAVGIGAVKYADLSSDRIKDYVFDWNRMLSFDGNTAPYLQYAHARIRSIFRRAEVDSTALVAVDPVITEPAERGLTLQLLAFSETLAATAEHLQPHRLCTWLFETAQAFTAFYEACPVLRAPDENTKLSRLALCDATAQCLRKGLNLLGIEAPERM